MTSDCDSHGDTIRYRCSHYQQGRKDGYAAALRDAVEAVKLSCSADIELVERSQVLDDIEALDKPCNI